MFPIHSGEYVRRHSFCFEPQGLDEVQLHSTEPLLTLALKYFQFPNNNNKKTTYSDIRNNIFFSLQKAEHKTLLYA